MVPPEPGRGKNQGELAGAENGKSEQCSHWISVPYWINQPIMPYHSESSLMEGQGFLDTRGVKVQKDLELTLNSATKLLSDRQPVTYL